MVLRAVLAAAVFIAFLAGSPSIADEYRPDEFLNLDLSKAVLSPKPLGPSAQFEPRRVEGKGDPQSKAVHVDAAPAQMDAVRKAPPKSAKIKVVHARVEKRRAPARATVARRHTNPLDAQASDTQIQVWPCRSGGICNWRR